MRNDILLTFDPPTAETDMGKLRISPNCSLDLFYRNENTPSFLKKVLEISSNWQTRNEMTIGKAIASRGSCFQFRAAWHAYGVQQDIDNDFLLLPTGNTNLRLGMSAVRATPADEPIVSVYAGIEMVDDKINTARIYACGLHNTQPLLLEKTCRVLIGTLFDQNSISSALAMMESEIHPISNYMASAEYRRAMAVVILKRALIECHGGA